MARRPVSGSRGFELPAAGKTGTSRDGWFAGYTKDYIVIAWVGFDDNTDLNIEGAHSALPIWTEFMKKAQRSVPTARHRRHVFRRLLKESCRSSVEQDTSELPIKGCTEDYVEAYLAGTVQFPCIAAPAGKCGLRFLWQGRKVAFGRLFGKDRQEGPEVY